ncbi:MAG: hypothetical protein ABJB16_10245 [Saprospiraceae bacterium]
MSRFLKLFIFSTFIIFCRCNLERIEPGSGNETKFSTTVGGNANDFPRDILANSDGSFVVVGYSQSFTAGDNEAYIGKLDKNGNLVWENHFGGLSDDYANAVVSTTDGGFVFCGNTKNPVSQNDDLLVVKVNSQGVVVWNKTYGAPDSTETGFGVSAVGTGSILVGYSSSLFGSITAVRFMTLNANGSRILDKLGILGPYYIRKMIKTSDSDIVIVGDDYSNATESYLAKFKNDGSFIWNKSFTGEVLNYAPGYGVAELQDKSLILAGSYLGSNDHDFLLVSYSAIGMEQWHKETGGANPDELFGITGTKDGEIAVMGYTRSFSTTNEIYLSKRNKLDGSEIWVKHFNETWTIGADMELCPDGGFVICTGQNQANADIIVIKTDANGNFQ